MKTKRFLLATAGSTVDGRNIDANMLTEMAEGYDPKTYSARLNIEHIRGFSGEKPFRAFGDVLTLETEDVDVNFHGKTEKRLGLFGTFDVTEDAKKLNSEGQKVFPSIEIEPNFGGKGKAYLMGVALTDSPASIATQRLEFSRSQPGWLTVGTDDKTMAFGLEFEGEDGKATEAADGFLAKFSAMLDAKFGKTEAKPEPKAKEGEDGKTDFAQLQPLFADLGKSFSDEIAAFRQEAATREDEIDLRFKALEDKLQAMPPEGYSQRPAAAGANGNQEMTDC